MILFSVRFRVIILGLGLGLQLTVRVIGLDNEGLGLYW